MHVGLVSQSLATLKINYAVSLIAFTIIKKFTNYEGHSKVSLNELPTTVQDTPKGRAGWAERVRMSTQQ